ncbi:ribosomal protein L21-like protein [Xylogone sp. PMI_703]|nr:ribosomal protein L21-like protein [Xylogone sp. PMI_703]
MFSRTIRRSVLEVQTQIYALPPTFLLPNRGRYFNSTAQNVEPPDAVSHEEPKLSSEALNQTSQSSSTQSVDSIAKTQHATTTSSEISPSIKELLPLLKAQPSHYISAHIHGRPYLVTPGDTLRLPFRMPGVVPGDILRLNRATAIGSRDYTLKGAPYLDERLFECRARVMGTEAEPVRIKEKTKRRNRKVKTVKSKHKFTILRISELKINELEDVKA